MAARCSSAASGTPSARSPRASSRREQRRPPCQQARPSSLTLRARSATETERGGWDDIVAATGTPHLLQTAAWAALKSTTGWRATRWILEDESGLVGAAQVLSKPLPLGLSVAYAPRGPLVEAAKLPEAVAAIARALAVERCAGLLCDPEVEDGPEIRAALVAAGARPAGVFVQPRRTLLMDLRRSPEELLGSMRKKTRQYIHKAERDGVVTEEARDLDRFVAILGRVAERDRFAIHDRAYFARLLDLFGERVHLLFARVGAEDAGALLVIRVADRAWELYGGWSGAHPEARPFYLLKWRSLTAMRQRGVTRYDMWGLAEREGDALSGVENFKLGFGGATVSWVGAYDLPVRPLLYPLWRLSGRRRLAAAAR
ncbi:MAG TPA: peptidoglycan bridge formation glycyltransferase FemA/FemB family protein [Candidatus Limnocylindria bacterium]